MAGIVSDKGGVYLITSIEFVILVARNGRSPWKKSASEREVICFCARMVLAAGEMVQRNQRLFKAKEKNSLISTYVLYFEKKSFSQKS